MLQGFWEKCQALLLGFPFPGRVQTPPARAVSTSWDDDTALHPVRPGDRRRDMRCMKRLTGAIVAQDGTLIPVRTMDLSRTGLAILASRHGLKPGMRLELRVRLGQGRPLCSLVVRIVREFAPSAERQHDRVSGFGVKLETVPVEWARAMDLWLTPLSAQA